MNNQSKTEYHVSNTENIKQNKIYYFLCTSNIVFVVSLIRSCSEIKNIGSHDGK